MAVTVRTLRDQGDSSFCMHTVALQNHGSYRTRVIGIPFCHHIPPP